MMLIGSKKCQKWRQNTNSGKKISRDCLVLGTRNALFSCFDQFSYFDHKLLITDPILVIQVAG